ncbi:MAG: maleylpyruvate isomerase family mycothiol-dependent enzyme [Sporichthyaceae bacterium]
MTTPAAVAASSQARVRVLPRHVAMRLAAHEYDLFVDQLRELSPEDWSRPTDCPAWDVHAMACHVLGMAEFAASVPEQVRQSLAARRAGGMFVDGLTAVQVDKHASRPPADVVARLAVVGPKAAAGRRRTPSLVRRFPLAGQPVEETGTQTEKWSLGYLTDVILTRDTWMHRSDIAAATGRSMTLTPEHDGVLVADIAAEWAGRHGQSCTLTLTGPAGGSWAFGGLGAAGERPALVLDAVEFLRILAGRGSGDGLLATRVPF